MTKHAIEAEELQAYLDRELAAGRAAEIARHLGECRECQAVLADLKRVSETLQRWQIGPAPASLRPPMVEEVEPQRRLSWRRLTWALAGTAVVALVVGSLTIPNLLKSRMAVEPLEPSRQTSAVKWPTQPPPASAPPAQQSKAPAERDRRGDLQARPAEEKYKTAPAKEGSGEVGGTLGGIGPGFKSEGRVADEAAPLEAGAAANRAVAKSAVAPPMIAYWVTMTVEVKEFAPAKEKLLKAVEEAGGYVAQASAAETPNQPQRADLTVRVPVEKLQSVLEQVRGLGRVVHEQLSSEEVTAQVVDLEARLRNSRATEERLISVLEQRTGKVADILQVEREIARTREEIERMEAQRKNLVARVELATVAVTLVEEFQAELVPAPVGTATRLRNAFVEGYDNLVGLLLGFVFFFARNGLVLAFWFLLLWAGWRLVRRPVLRLVSSRS